MGEREIVALHPPGEPGPYPAEVRHRIRRDVQEDYHFIAQGLNGSGVEVVSIQYDPAIWGGPEGAYVLDFVRALRVPFVATLHAVDSQASAEQQRILAELAASAATCVVMSYGARDVLSRLPGVDPGRIQVVPYGVSALPLVDPDSVKARIGMQGKSLIFSFGLIGPGKGFESVIEAMPAVVREVPTARYVILGATHPDAIRNGGEPYRAELEATLARTGVGASVELINRFVGRTELAKWLQAADVFVAPATRLERTVSGTLAYAMGAGKAIVATRSAYAEEQLDGGCGRFVTLGAPDDIADAIIAILKDRDLRTDMGRQAYERSRNMVWWEVGARYRRIFEGAGSRGGPAARRSSGRAPDWRPALLANRGRSLLDGHLSSPARNGARSEVDSMPGSPTLHLRTGTYGRQG